MRTIYFLQAESGPIKIGIANNFPNRLKAINTHNHEKLTPIYIFESAKDIAGRLEKALHKYFKDYRIKGEWFWNHKVVLTAIEQFKKNNILDLIKLEPINEIKKNCLYGTPLHKIPRTLAEKIGCHPTYIDKINAGKALPSPKLCKRIIAEMQEQGEKITFFDLRPDLKEMVVESL